MSKPFYQGTTKGCWWNSLAVIDTGIVVAVGGLDGKITMVKGYPMKQFLAPYASQLTDGRLTSADSYYNSSAQQVPMGSETGTFAYTDFSYDSDNLYMTCIVYRRNARSEEPFPDGVTFYVEAKGASTDVPMSSSYRFDILPNGSFKTFKGNGTNWVETTLPSVRAAGVVVSANYRVEMAIPWTAISLSDVPFEQSPSVNLEIITGDGSQQIVERIPDSSPLKPATWLPLKLIESEATGINEIKSEKLKVKNEGAAYDLSGRKTSTTHRGIFIQEGRKFVMR